VLWIGAEDRDVHWIIPHGPGRELGCGNMLDPIQFPQFDHGSAPERGH
jgi:hypothetical protein